MALAPAVPDVSFFSRDAVIIGEVEVLEDVVNPSPDANSIGLSRGSYVSIPSSTFDLIENEVSIALWVRGENQPRRDSVFFATNAEGKRIINIHLPWNNSQIFWDCGYGEGAFDRIQASADPSSFEGVWNHWVFTKNASTGQMAMYLNGSLFHLGEGNTRVIEGITDASISRAGNLGYSGSVDDVQIYNVELTAEEVSTLFSSYNE